ncbi:MAG: 2-phospho-L-lactate transferase CofD family protein, partial [Microcystaceae cyanobacterium]
HLKAIDKHSQYRLFDAVLVQRTPPSAAALKHYAQENCHPVFVDREEIANLVCRLVIANVMEENEKTHRIRHDPQRLSRVLLRWYGGQ